MRRDRLGRLVWREVSLVGCMDGVGKVEAFRLREVVVVVCLAVVVGLTLFVGWPCEVALHVKPAVVTCGFLGASAAQDCWGCALLWAEGYPREALLALCWDLV